MIRPSPVNHERLSLDRATIQVGSASNADAMLGDVVPRCLLQPFARFLNRSPFGRDSEKFLDHPSEPAFLVDVDRREYGPNRPEVVKDRITVGLFSLRRHAKPPEATGYCLFGSN